MTGTEDLYGLLPAVHRLRDAALAGGGPGPLHELVEILAAQADVVDADLTALADAWFIETCAGWLVPYLGDLLGTTRLQPIGTAASEPRAHVARALEHRQRKGTIAVLEQVAHDVTGWPTRAAEMAHRLAWTQHLDHVRPERSATPDLRSPEVGDLVDGPFDTAPRTVEVRRLPTRAGRYNIANVGLFTYRLQPQTVERAEAVRAEAPGGWHLDPLGRDLALANPGRAEASLAALAEEADLPGTLRRRPLAEELESLRTPVGTDRAPAWFRDHRPVVLLEVRQAPDAGWAAVDPEELVVCDLDGWRPPPADRRYPDPADGGEVVRPLRAALDPVRGRVAFRPEHEPAALRTTHTTAAPMPLGGGPYDRRQLDDPHAPAPAAPPDRRLLVGRELLVRDGVFDRLDAAVAAWRAAPAGHTEIVVTDNGVYPEDLQGASRLELTAGVTLRIVAAGAALPPAGRLPDPSAALHPAGVRPVVTGRVSVRGTGTHPDGVGGLAIEGLWLAGGLTVLVGNLAALRLVDATLVPGRADLEVRTGAAGGNRALVLELARTITGPLLLGGTARVLRLHTAVVDADGRAIEAEAAAVTLVDCTILGAVAVQTLHADNVIFTGPVRVERRQAGCLRYCALPAAPSSRTPRRYRCQPDLAVEAAAEAAGGALAPQLEAAVRRRVQPLFTSRTHGDAAYGQLALRAPPEIRAGAADGSEMGVHRALRQPAREANLATALSEHLRAGLEAGPLPVT